MGVGVWAFVFNESGDIKKVSSGMFEKVLMGRSNQSFPEYSGKKIRLAMVYVDMVNRRPVNIIRTDYLRVGFDVNGCFENGERTEKMQLAVKTGEASDLRLAAHSLKSNSADFGADVLRDLCKNGESMGKEGKLNGAGELVSNVIDEYKKLETVLQKLRNEMFTDALD